MNQDKRPGTGLKKTTPAELHENGLRAGSLIEQAVARLDPEQTKTLMAKAGEEALRLEVKNREQNMDYVAGRKAAEDHIEMFDMLEKNGRLTRQTVSSDIKTGAGNMKIESKSGATCFVASAAYGDPNHPDVMFLRGFRDNTLRNSAAGRIFIDLYWRVGPHLAVFVEKWRPLKRLSKYLISKIVTSLR